MSTVFLVVRTEPVDAQPMFPEHLDAAATYDVDTEDLSIHIRGYQQSPCIHKRCTDNIKMLSEHPDVDAWPDVGTYQDVGTSSFADDHVNRAAIPHQKALREPRG